MRRALGILIGLLLVLPGSASAATATSVTFLGLTDGSGHPDARLFTPANATVYAQPTYTDGSGNITVSVDTASEGEYSIDLAPRKGEFLKPGVYDDAARPVEARPDQPGLDIAAAGLDCGAPRGRFEIKDIAQDSSRNVQRLWVIYEQPCAFDPPGVYGEIRINEPVSDSAPAPAPSIMRRPEDDLGHAQSSQPVWFIAPAGGTQVTSASIGGTNAADFSKGTDTCTGRTIAAGASCSVSVGFTATGAGTRLATLTVTDAAGHTVDVPLQGWVHGGTTKVTTRPDPGYPSGVSPHDYTPANALFGVPGKANDVPAAAQPFDHYLTRVVVEVQPPWGGTLAPGRYSPVARNPANGSAAAGLAVVSDGLACNTTSGEFTVNEITWRPDGYVKTLGVDFVQYCDDTGKALRGTYDFRAGDDAGPAPWMDPATQTGTESGAPAPGDAPSTPVTSSDPCTAPAFAAAKVRTGTRRSNRIRGSRKSEVIRAGAGNDVVRAGGGRDCVEGEAGRDRLDGGSGGDVLAGGPGRDVLVCGPGKDMAIVGPGDRTRECEIKVRVKQ